MLAATSAPRIDAKRRAALDPRKKQFAKAAYAPEAYPHRLNFYATPPTGDVSLEHFEEWAIARLKVLAELEACAFRNRSRDETDEYMKPVLERWLRMSGNRAKLGPEGGRVLEAERRRDHYSHWTLRLAFAGTAELRSRFVRLESALFALRMRQESVEERREFVAGLAMSWEAVTGVEREELAEELRAATGVWRDEEESWFKVPWERVPELVERRQCLVKRGTAYVHVREQSSLVVSDFTRHLEAGMELAARFLPRMDEDNRLAPILHHLSQAFVAPDAGYTEASSIGDMATPTAASIDGLSQHFPLCMQNLHRELRKNDHLKHYGRLQYTLFLKGIGLSLQECIAFWRMSFKKITDGPSLPCQLPFPSHITDPSAQRSSNPNTFTTSATPTATWAATPTSGAEATLLTPARNCLLKPCPLAANRTVALTALTAPITSLVFCSQSA